MLYRASQAGVRIDLIIRGICCLRPGMPGVSDNIRVISIVDKYLEHSRIAYFQNGDEPEVFLASADWMPRNFRRRVEIMFPIEDPQLQRRLVDGILGVVLADNVKARELQPDGTYRRVAPAAAGRAEHPLAGRVPEHGASSSARPARSAMPRWDRSSAPEGGPIMAVQAANPLFARRWRRSSADSLCGNLCHRIPGFPVSFEPSRTPETPLSVGHDLKPQTDFVGGRQLPRNIRLLSAGVCCRPRWQADA